MIRQNETKCILFDEIQNLHNWELFLNRLHRKGFNLVITGSNSRLLCRELATHLTGRYIPEGTDPLPVFFIQGHWAGFR
ncbi:MAG TPA: hypothetical protein DDX84_10085 [Nitrospiraceae bacterium]|nr:hypothetical protein [Nitrospiraceae bacterium]